MQYRGFALPIGMSPTCFEELTQALSDFEHDRAGFAEEVAIRVFEIVARHRA